MVEIVVILDCECLYCGKRFKERIWSNHEVDRIKCPDCNDKNIKKIESKKQNIFGYEEDK